MNNAILAPNRLLIVVWLAAITLYSIAFKSLPSFIVVSWVALMLLTFSIGGSIVAPRNFIYTGSRGNISVIKNIIVLLLPFEFLYIQQCIVVAMESGGIAPFLLAMRRASLAGEPLIPGSRFYLQINAILSMLALYGISVSLFSPTTSKTSSYKKLFYLVYIIVLLSSVMDGSRSILIAGVLNLLALNLAYGRLSFKSLSIFLIGMLLVFSITFSLFRSDAGNNNFVSALNFTFVYASGSVGSMQFALQRDVEVFWQDLENLSNKLSSLGLPTPTFELTELKMDFVDLPGGIYQTNVFSAFAIYYQYFGLIVGVYFAFFIGWLSALVYRCRLKSPLTMTIYAFFWSAVVLSVFHDYFLSTFYMTLKLLILAFMMSVFAAMKRFLIIVSLPLRSEIGTKPAS